MSDFDPYRKWLGIRPEEQPPHHYRLLGISLYEDDPDVIDAAVEQRVTFLHTCASGPNLKHSQQILNEVAEARNVLLDAETKKAYDAGLRVEADQAAAAVGKEEPPDAGQVQPADSKVKRKRVLPSGAASADEPDTDSAKTSSKPDPSGTDSGQTGSVSAQYRLRKNRSTGLALAVLFGVAATGGLLWWLLKGDGADTIDELAQGEILGVTNSGTGDSGSETSETGTGGETSTNGSSKKGSTGGTPTDSTGTRETTTNPKPETSGSPRAGTNTVGVSGKPATKAAYDASGITARQPGIAAQLSGHKSAVVAVAISGDLNTVVSAGEDGTVLVHSLADSNRIVDQFRMNISPVAASFNSQGNRLAVMNPRAIIVRDFREQRQTWVEGPHPGPVFTCLTHRAFTPYYLVGLRDGSSVLRGRGENLNVKDRPRLVGHTAPITCVALSASGRIAVTASEDNTLRVWNVVSQSQVAEYPVEAALKKVAVSPDERRVVAISELGLHSWDLHKQVENPVVPVHDGVVSGVAFIGEQPLAVTSGLDGTVQVTDLESLLATLTLSSSSKATRHLAVSPDGIAAVTAGTPSDGSNKVLVWRLPASQSVRFGTGAVPHDVLAHLNVKRDLIRGSWKYEDRLLVSGTENVNEIHLPATVPEEYTLDMRVRRSNGMGPLRVHLPFQNTVGSLVINAVRGQISGLEFIDGSGVADNGTGFNRNWIVSWKREHVIRATVTKEGIKASVDGTILFDWKGTPDQLIWELDRDPDWPIVREVRLMTGSAQYTFSSIQLLPPGGEPSTSSGSPIMAIATPEQVAAPSDAEIQTAVALIRDNLAGAYSDTKNRSTLIAQLIRMANDAKGEPATQCAAWSEAASLAADGGDATQAFLALDRMTTRYEGSFFELKEKVFSTLLRKRDTATMAQLALFGFSWIEDLIDAEQFDEATSVLSRTRGASIRLKDQRLRDLADYLNTRIRTLTRSFTAAEESAATLAANPDDAAAAEVVGRFRCFSVENWEQGLPLLARSEDATLKQLAEQDLAQPTSPDEQVALADAWWAYSTTQPASDRDAIRRRAGVWYIYAIRGLPQIRQAEVRQKELKVPSESANLSIAAKVEAGDTVTIRREGVVWRSSVSKPTNVHINKFPWDVKADSRLLNRGSTRFLPHGIHFGRVRLRKIQGRDDVEMSVTGDEITLKFPERSGVYQLLLSFGS